MTQFLLWARLPRNVVLYKIVLYFNKSFLYSGSDSALVVLYVGTLHRELDSVRVNGKLELKETPSSNLWGSSIPKVGIYPCFLVMLCSCRNIPHGVAIDLNICITFDLFCIQMKVIYIVVHTFAFKTPHASNIRKHLLSYTDLLFYLFLHANINGTRNSYDTLLSLNIILLILYDILLSLKVTSMC